MTLSAIPKPKQFVLPFCKELTDPHEQNIQYGIMGVSAGFYCLTLLLAFKNIYSYLIVQKRYKNPFLVLLYFLAVCVCVA